VRRHTGIRMFALLILVFSSALLMARLSEIPSNLMISVRLGLWRAGDQSGGYIGKQIVSLTKDRYVSRHNVSLVRPWKGFNATGAFWSLLICMNETAKSWQQENVVRPVEAVAGEYEGAVNQTIEFKGTFRLWVLLYSRVNESRVLKDSKSELVSVYPWLRVYSISSDLVFGRLSTILKAEDLDEHIRHT